MRPELLVKENESEWLDFKAEFHENNVNLVHDILCLANAYSDNDRYLCFGVKNDKTVCGVEADPNRKTNADIQDLLRQSNFNRIPTVTLKTYQNFHGHEVDVLEIKNRPDKPFFLTEDKSFRGKTIRGGVVYTRLSDTNIPLGESAPEDQVELMWRERFGLGLDPLSRLSLLLDERDDWVDVHGDSYIYHRQFPEFTITESETVTADFSEPWTEKFPNRKAWSYYVECRYFTTVLKKTLYVSCDGGRYRVPAPERKNGEWVIDTSSPEYKISEIYRQYHPLPEMLKLAGIKFI